MMKEVGGEFGAKAIAEYLKGQGVQLEFVLDEGGTSVDRWAAAFHQGQGRGTGWHCREGNATASSSFVYVLPAS